MKAKRFNKKLMLSKNTIADLSKLQMDTINAGDVWTIINPPYIGGLPFTCEGYTCYGNPEKMEGLCLGQWALSIDLPC